MKIASRVPGDDIGSYARSINSYRYLFSNNLEAVSLQIMSGFSCASSSTKRTFTSPPPRIDPRYGVWRVRPKVNPPLQSNRIRRYEPPNIRIVESEGVVVQPRIAVKVLPLKPQVLLPGFVLGLITCIKRMRLAAISLDQLPLFSLRIAPGLVGGLPDQLALGIGEFFR